VEVVIGTPLAAAADGTTGRRDDSATLKIPGRRLTIPALSVRGSLPEAPHPTRR
jgi:hypothetical protein